MKNKIKKLLASVIVFVVAAGLVAVNAVTVKAAGTGSVTVTNATVGQTYTIYKVFDATYSGNDPNKNVAYTYTKKSGTDPFLTALQGTTSPFDVTETSTESGVYSVVKKSTATDDAVLSFIKTQGPQYDEAEKKWTTNDNHFGQAIDSKAATSQSVEFTGLDFGYYFITTTTGSTVTINSAVPHSDVIDKNQTPTFDKNIVEAGSGDSTTLTKTNEANLGETVNFNITVNAKNYDGDKKILSYLIKDTLDNGWTLTAAPVVKIVNSGTSITNDTEARTAGTDYTIKYYNNSTSKTEQTITGDNYSSVQYFEITLPWTSDSTANGTFKYDANSTVQVTYSAKLDPAKASNVTVGNTPNKNTADVNYTKDDTDHPTGDLPDVTTNTYVTAVTIHKTKDDNSPLTGAEFELTSTDGTAVVFTTGTVYAPDDNGTYYKLKNGSYTTTAPTDSNSADYEGTTQKYSQKTNVTIGSGQSTATSMKAFVDNNGNLTFKGLGAGTYTLKETTVPAGYNKAEDITFKLTFNAGDATFNSDNSKVTVVSDTPNTFETTIQNKKGSLLPSTGGIGTTIFYIAGGILIIGAAALLINRKKRENA